MKIILTGGAGFIGSCFLWQLNSMGIDDVIVVDTESDPSAFPNLTKKKFKAYITREDLLHRLDQGQLKDVDAIVHLGACADTLESDRQFLSQNNVEYSKTLATWALAQNKVFHYASSAAVYGDGKKGYDDTDEKVHMYKPLNPYGESKLAFDRWVIDQKFSDRVVGYRFFNVFGPNEYHKGEMSSMVSKAYQQLESTGQVKLFSTTRADYPNGSEERDFVYVKYVNKVMAFFLEHQDKTGIFNLGSGQARSFKDLVTAVFSALGKEPSIEYIPMPEKLRSQYQYFTQANVDKLRQAGYDQPFQTLENAVADYVKTHLVKSDPYL